MVVARLIGCAVTYFWEWEIDIIAYLNQKHVLILM